MGITEWKKRALGEILSCSKSSLHFLTIESQFYLENIKN